MAGNITGGKKAAAKNLAKDPNFYKEIGRKGGSAPTTKPKGFAANPELARISGQKGGKISRRGPTKREQPEPKKSFWKQVFAN